MPEMREVKMAEAYPHALHYHLGGGNALHTIEDVFKRIATEFILRHFLVIRHSEFVIPNPHLS